MDDKLQKTLIWIRNFAYIACVLFIYFFQDDVGSNPLGVGVVIIFTITIVYVILAKICSIPSGMKNKRYKDEKIYSQVLLEIESNDYRKGLLAKALAEAGGDEKKSRAIYIKLRYQSIKDQM